MTTYKYASLIEKHFQVVLKSGPEWMCRCVWHDDGNASLQVNVEKGLYLCFAGNCGARGNIRSLERFLGIRFDNEVVDVQDIRDRLDALKRPVERQVVLAESTLNRYRMPTDYWGPCPTPRHRDCTGRPGCKHHRWFTPETIKAFDLGSDPLNDCVTIPVRTVGGDLIGIIKRYLDPDAELRYRYPKGFKRSLNLFGSWLVEQDPDAHTVVLVEGALDAITVWQAGYPAMAVYGSSLSAAQVRLLKRLGIVRVVLAFDNDAAGRKCAQSALGWHDRKRGSKIVREYDAATDVSRFFIVDRGRYAPSMPSDPGAMDQKQVDEMLRRTGIMI